MLELEAALEKILAALPAPEPESVSLDRAHRRVLAENVTAPLPLPAFDNSAMDGYAVRAADVAGAKPEQPAVLRWIGQVAAGETFAGKISPGECVRIFTGSPLPAGADAVVMQEATRVEPGAADEVLVLATAKAGET